MTHAQKAAASAAEQVDPITFEVIKHRLWQINDEQGLAIKTISSSPIVVEGNDFNVGLFTADGQLTTAGIGSLVHVGTMGTSIRSIMRIIDDIEEGDVFLMNDPFLGALHQNDVVVASPLFRDGRIVLWVANVLHHPDVGGIDEGSFCISARNLYQDPPRYLLKIVSKGKLVASAEHTFVTNSRLPDMVALDLRAQIGAIHVAKTRLDALMDERGTGTIETVMQRSIDMSEAQLRAKIGELPEGAWTGEAYMDGVRVGLEDVVRVKVRLTHRGDKLIFDYEGTDPQVEAAVNCTYHACVAGTAVPLYSFFCQGDIDWNEGLIRCLEVIAPEGTVANATFPAPVSICTIGFRWLVTVASAQAVARMFDASETYRDRVCSSWIVSSNCNNLFGHDANGRRVGALLSDHRGGGAAARSFADGISHAGQVTSFSSSLGNVEGTEWKLPLLYLYRRQLSDSAGVGKYRGGLSSVAAVTPYGTSGLVLKSTNTAGTNQTNAHGIAGGYPGAGSQAILVRRSQAMEKLSNGTLKSDYTQLGGEVEYLPSKASATLVEGDVLVFYPPGGGGYGDPLTRAPEAVLEDVQNGRVSPEWAARAYGVVVRDGQVNAAETQRLRAEARAGRKSWPAQDWTPDFSTLKAGSAGRLGATMRRDAAGAVFCDACGDRLDGSGGAAVARLSPIGQAGPWAARRFGGDTPAFKLQEVACGCCGTLVHVEEVRT